MTSDPPETSAFFMADDDTLKLNSLFSESSLIAAADDGVFKYFYTEYFIERIFEII